MSDPTQQQLAQLLEANLKALDKLSQAPAPARQTDQSESTGSLAAALAQAQGKFSNPERTKTAKVKGKSKDGTPIDYSYKYADLAEILSVVRGPLSEAGLSYSQDVRFDNANQEAVVATTLRHESGEWIRSVLRFPATANKIQELGSVFTYLRRYSLSALIGIAPEDDDDAQLAVEAEREARRSGKGGKGQQQQQQDGDMPNEEQLAEFWAQWKAMWPTRFATKEEAGAWLKSVDPNPTKANMGKLRSILNRLKLVKELEGKAKEQEPAAKGKADQATGAGESKKGKGKEAKPSTPEEKRRQALQTRWRMLLGDKFKRFDQAQALEAACWWAAEYFGWVRDPKTEEISGQVWPTRPRASLTPVESVAKAVDALAKLSEDEADQIFDEYSHWINEQLRELNPSAEAEPEAGAE